MFCIFILLNLNVEFGFIVIFRENVGKFVNVIKGYCNEKNIDYCKSFDNKYKLNIWIGILGFFDIERFMLLVVVIVVVGWRIVYLFIVINVVQVGYRQ